VATWQMRRIRNACYRDGIVEPADDHPARLQKEEEQVSRKKPAVLVAAMMVLVVAARPA
jgi:hypothetical protein